MKLIKNKVWLLSYLEMVKELEQSKLEFHLDVVNNMAWTWTSVWINKEGKYSLEANNKYFLKIIPDFNNNKDNNNKDKNIQDINNKNQDFNNKDNNNKDKIILGFNNKDSNNNKDFNSKDFNSKDNSNILDFNNKDFNSKDKNILDNNNKDSNNKDSNNKEWWINNTDIINNNNNKDIINHNNNKDIINNINNKDIINNTDNKTKGWNNNMAINNKDINNKDSMDIKVNTDKVEWWKDNSQVDLGDKLLEIIILKEAFCMQN